jgi:ribonuclease BN (tRNA processing enzyme)
LVADRSAHIHQLMQEAFPEKYYSLHIVADGLEFKRQVRTLAPDLIMMEILLPRHHGIELLKWLKSHPDLAKTGVFIMTYELMQQNYRAAYDYGADLFLEKPFTAQFIQSCAENYFSGRLDRQHFQGHRSIDLGIDSYYEPKFEPATNYIKFWGTRGSSATSGGEYSKFGGNTCCMELKVGDDYLIFDSGTGIRPLGEELIQKGNHNLHLFISHTHQDHVVGFPFFMPLYFDTTNLTIYSPNGFEKQTKDLFTDMLAYSFFPVRLEEMRAQLQFVDICDGDQIKVGNLTVEMCYTYHPGATVGFKITTGRQKIAYFTDNEFLVGFHGHPRLIGPEHPLLNNYRQLIDFLSDCDIIIHEAQYFPNEYLERVGWGHSSMVNASMIFQYIKCPTWIVVHHDPRHTDKDLNYKAELHRKILHDAEIYTHLRYAYDGMIVPLE